MENNITDNTLRVGVIASTHGIKGEVKVYPTTDDPTRFEYLKEAIIDAGRDTRTVEIENVKYFKQFVILKFKGIDDINDVEKYVKKDLLVTRDNAVPLEEGEYYICDLVGLKVITDDGRDIGILTDIMQTGANDVYVVNGDTDEEILIPSIPQCILDRDLEKGIITVHLLKWA